MEYRLESATQWQTNFPAHHGLIDADVTTHNVALAGLEPGTAYRYRVVSREIVEFKPYQVTYGATLASPEYGFTTFDPRKPAAAFVVLNDRHEKVEPLAASLAAVDWARVGLVFFNGDAVNSVESESQLYRCLVDPIVPPFATRIPLVYVRGNHDTRGKFARQLLNYFPTDSGRYYYTLQEGPVMFLVLDGAKIKRTAAVNIPAWWISTPICIAKRSGWPGKSRTPPSSAPRSASGCCISRPPTIPIPSSSAASGCRITWCRS